ncbi:MAG TPA: DUF1236 domain-containing protein [Bradyrhizobium sp.]
MKLHLIAVAAAALTAGIGIASAADMHAKSNTMSKTTMSKTTMSKTPAMQSMAKDNLTLTRSQQRTAWRDLSKQASNQTAPSNFTASVGATIPGDVTIKAVPAKVAARVSSLKPYDFALLNDKLVIVNPNDKKVVDVIKRHA